MEIDLGFLFSALQKQSHTIRRMKRKSELINIFDNLRSQDSNKRLASVKSIKELASTIGVQKTKSDLVPLLIEFVDDEEAIVLELIDKLQDFAPLLGEAQNLEILIPLLIAFCKSDEKKIGTQAIKLIQKIIEGKKDLTLSVAKSLSKTRMKVTSECLAKLISKVVGTVPEIEEQLLVFYNEIFKSDNPATLITCAKYLENLLQNVSKKKSVEKMLEAIFGSQEELATIYALPALAHYIKYEPVFAFSKLKNILIVNSWRTTLKLLELVPVFEKNMTKQQIKTYLEMLIFKQLISQEAELRNAAVKSLVAFSPHLQVADVKQKLWPIIVKLEQDPQAYVKVTLSQNILKISHNFDATLIEQFVLPLVFKMMKSRNLSLTEGILSDLHILMDKIPQKSFRKHIIQPLTRHFEANNWRVKCSILEILLSFISNPLFAIDEFLRALVQLTNDKIGAVREKAMKLVAKVLMGTQESQNIVFSRMKALSDDGNYIRRQNMLEIIELTNRKMNGSVVKDIFKPFLISALDDKVANVRVKALQVFQNNKKLLDKDAEKKIKAMSDDEDMEVKQLAKSIRG